MLNNHICIVGGGINGLMTAYYLRNDYKKITLIEKNRELCRESSYYNAGTLFFSRIKPIFSSILPKKVSAGSIIITALLVILNIS